jgi:hypothetical protein
MFGRRKQYYCPACMFPRVYSRPGKCPQVVSIDCKCEKCGLEGGESTFNFGYVHEGCGGRVIYQETVCNTDLILAP